MFRKEGRHQQRPQSSFSLAPISLAPPIASSTGQLLFASIPKRNAQNCFLAGES
jgi:hypothetical protein